MKKFTDESFYYPKTTLDSISAQKQKYPSPNYYPYPDPKNTFRLNPLVLTSLKNLDIDDLQDVFGKGLQEKRQSIIGEKIENEKMFSENFEIKEIKASIELAKVNRTRALQMQQNQMKRIQNLVKDTEADQEVLKKLEMDKIKAQEDAERKKNERIKAKHQIQQQIKEKEEYKKESEKEYQKDLKDIENIMNKIKKEDLEEQKEIQKKRDIQRMYMKNSYAEKEERKRKEKEEERLQKERERKYQEYVAKRENDLADKKAQIQQGKDKIFEQLCQEEAKRQAERDYWENVRNELQFEQEYQKEKQKEKEEKEKLIKQKEDMLNSAIEQMKRKKEELKKEKEIEEEIKNKLLIKYKEEEKMELLNLQKKKEKELEMKKEIEKQWQIKLEQYQKQINNEIEDLNKKKEQNKKKNYLIELEKRRLIQENEKLLKDYYPVGYKKAIGLLQEIPQQNNEVNKKNNIIFNNIFGNSNPNKSYMYPKYGKIKNFVYDKSIQDIHPNIDKINYPMYNATANNDYDSYPSPEEYKKMMKKTGQINFAYAGGKETKGIPMRTQRPIYNNNDMNRKWITGNEVIKTQYNNGYLSHNSSFQNINKSIGTNSFIPQEQENIGRRFNNSIHKFYQKQNSNSNFSSNLTMNSIYHNGIHSPENYQQTIKNIRTTPVPI